MKHYLQYIMVILFAALITGCNSYSKYPIDEKPQIKIDSGLLGIWKTVEDSDKANFILVQSPYDIFYHAAQWHNMDNSEKRKIIDEHVADTEGRKMMFESAMDKNDANYYERYYKFLAENNYVYYITYFDDHGKNPQYQQWSSSLSKINDQLFLNIGNMGGYIFMHIIRINAAYDTITIAQVADTTLQYLTTSKAVRKHLKNNINNSAFYSDTMHFYKVNGYHLSLNEAKDKAN